MHTLKGQDHPQSKIWVFLLHRHFQQVQSFKPNNDILRIEFFEITNIKITNFLTYFFGQMKPSIPGKGYPIGGTRIFVLKKSTCDINDPLS